MKSFLILTVVSLIFVGCGPKEVNVSVAKNRTDLGHINTQRAKLGYLFIWDRKERTVSKAYSFNSLDNKYVETDTAIPRSLKMLSESEIAFIGGVTLTKKEKATLSSEIVSKIDIDITNPIRKSINGTKGVLIRALNADKNISHEIEIDKVIKNPDLYYVLVYEATEVQKTSLNVNNNKEAGAEYTSKVLPAQGEIKVKITDAAKIEFVNDVAFVRYEVLKPYINNMKNYAFDRETRRYSKALLKDIKGH